MLQTRTGRRRGKKKKKRREGAKENDRQIDWLCGRAVSVALVVMHPNSAQSSGSRFWRALLCRGPLCSTGPAGDNRITSCCGGLVGHGAISLGLCSTTHRFGIYILPPLRSFSIDFFPLHNTFGHPCNLFLSTLSPSARLNVFCLLTVIKQRRT